MDRAHPAVHFWIRAWLKAIRSEFNFRNYNLIDFELITVDGSATTAIQYILYYMYECLLWFGCMRNGFVIGVHSVHLLGLVICGMNLYVAIADVMCLFHSFGFQFTIYFKCCTLWSTYWHYYVVDRWNR